MGYKRSNKRIRHQQKQLIKNRSLRNKLSKKGPRIARNISLLQLIAKSKPKYQKSITQSLCDDTIKCIADCSRNILHGRIHLTNTEKKLLSRYRNALRHLAKKGKTASKRQLILKQKGGFLSLLIKPIVSAIQGLING